jgi:hypothetical protein
VEHGRPVRRTAGYGCTECHERTSGHLGELVGWYDAAATLLLPGSSTGGGRSTERTIGIRVAALDIRNGREWIDVLHSWERVVREERQLAAVPLWSSAADPTRATLVRLVAFHHAHLDWMMLRFPAVDEFADEVSRLARQGRALQPSGADSRFRVACPTDGCGRQITVGADDVAGNVICRHCGVERTVEFLMRAAEGDHWADADALSVRFGVTTRTLRRWAASGDVRRRNGLYCVGDVLARGDRDVV